MVRLAYKFLKIAVNGDKEQFLCPQEMKEQIIHRTLNVTYMYSVHVSHSFTCVAFVDAKIHPRLSIRNKCTRSFLTMASISVKHRTFRKQKITVRLAKAQFSIYRS